MDSVIVTTALVCSVVVLDFGFCLRGHDKPQEGSIVTSASPRMGLVVMPVIRRPAGVRRTLERVISV